MNNNPIEIRIMRRRSNTRNIDALAYMSASNYIKELIKMNKKEEILEKIDEAKEQITELQKTIDHLEEQLNKESKWPKEDDLYYYISGCGSIDRAFFEKTEYHIAKIEIGNCFKTKEEAEFELEKLKVRAELKEFSFKPTDWNKDTTESKYSIYYDNISQKLAIDYILFMQDDTIYFKSRDVANKAIKKVGEDRIKKYLFGKE